MSIVLPIKAEEEVARKNNGDEPETSDEDVENKGTDEQQQGEVVEIEEEATWHDVYVTCCVHTPTEWFYGSLQFTVVLFFLWCFLITLDLMGTSSQVMTGCIAGELFGDNANPVAGLMIGIICTALVQSSSTTTSIIVSLVGSAISVEQGIYMVRFGNATFYKSFWSVLTYIFYGTR
jgi:ABC-type phosphate transport system permease subunit